jgi:hypothetical protein
MEPLYFQACEEVDMYFREGREFFNETYVKKLAQTSTYFSRLREATWPLNTGTTQKGFRFGRGFFDPTKPWRKVVSKRCEGNSCDVQPDKIIRPGTDSYFFELIKKELITDWICVEDLMYRLLPVEEIMQFEESNARITKTVHEEIARTTYVGASGHKWVAFVDDSNEYCGIFDDQGWYMAEFDGTDGQTGFDSRYIYVKCDPADLENIARLSLSLLDDALADLGDEDEAYRLDLREAGSLKIDIIVPEPKVARQIFLELKESTGYVPSAAGYDPQFPELRLGVSRIIGDYSFGFDGSALRYNADSVYNSAVAPGGPDGTGLPTFDENDPDTWPRLVRVMKYVEQKTEIGYEYIPNKEYRKADFGISIQWMNDAIVKWRNPSWTGTGQVKMESQNYAGDFEWRRPDWECNRKRKMGFFEAEFKLAMQVKDPTVMHSFLHRLDHSRQLTGAACPLNTTYVPPTAIDVYVCDGTQPVE